MPATKRKLMAILVAVLTMFSVITSANSVFADGEPKIIEINARQFEYSPNIIEVNRGDRVILRLTTLDVTHGLFLDGYELEMHVRPGEVAEIEFVADKAGRFMFRCSYTCGSFHPYMIGWLRVQPNTPFNATVGLTAIIAIGSMAYFWIRRD